MEKFSNNEVEKIFEYWTESSNNDFDTMLSMYKTKHYDWALFIGHLSMEKLLKALYVKKHKTHAPLIHNLHRLAELNELNLSNDEMANWLLEITSFNLNVRYDDYKISFYKKCTADFANEWIEKITKVRSWIQKEF